MRIGLAFRAFFKAMFDPQAAERMALALDGQSPVPTITEAATKPTAEKPSAAPAPAKPVSQNPAITLLATLQRDARLIDLIHENLDQYQDAQVGAAARPCLKQCRQSLDRMLKITRLVDAAENESITVPSDASPARYRWIGESSSDQAANAKLVHAGWQATGTDLPKWSGDAADENVIAPAQITL